MTVSLISSAQMLPNIDYHVSTYVVLNTACSCGFQGNILSDYKPRKTPQRNTSRKLDKHAYRICLSPGQPFLLQHCSVHYMKRDMDVVFSCRGMVHTERNAASLFLSRFVRAFFWHPIWASLRSLCCSKHPHKHKKYFAHFSFLVTFPEITRRSGYCQCPGDSQ